MIKIMTNPDLDETRKVKIGFSWTTFFFGWIPSAIRGDFVSALKLFLWNILTLRIYGAWKAFSINEDYEEFLELKGYQEEEIIDGGAVSIPAIEYLLAMLRSALPVVMILFLVGVKTDVFQGNELIYKIPVLGEFVSDNSEDELLEEEPSNVINNFNIEEKVVIDTPAPKIIHRGKAPIKVPSKVPNENDSNKKEESKDDEFISKYNSFINSNMVANNHSSFNRNNPFDSFTDELIKIDESVQEIKALHEASDSYNNAQKNAILNKEYQMYDKELNYIWKYLEQNLDSDTLKTLTDEEVAWIKSKDKNGLETKIEMTEERCYYLLQYV